MPANVFEWDGWQGQFARARRWLNRFLDVANDWENYSLDVQIDFALVFFQNTYHVRDYLLHEHVAAQKAVDDLMRESQPLRIARDLANGSKHRVLSRPSVDSAPWIHRSLNFGGAAAVDAEDGPGPARSRCCGDGMREGVAGLLSGSTTRSGHRVFSSTGAR